MKTKKEIKIGDITFEFNSPNNLDNSTLDMMIDWCRLIEQQQIIDEVYENFVNTIEINRPDGYVRPVISKEEFIFESKFNTEFSEKWGLKIEERELSLEERVKIQMSNVMYSGPVNFEEEYLKEVCDKNNVPTKLITITYNNQTIMSYEIRRL